MPSASDHTPSAAKVRDLTDYEAREIERARFERRLTPELARWHARKFIAANGRHNTVRLLAEAFIRLQDGDHG